MDPKEKEKMAEELNVEETKDTAEEQPYQRFLNSNPKYMRNTITKMPHRTSSP